MMCESKPRRAHVFHWRSPSEVVRIDCQPSVKTAPDAGDGEMFVADQNCEAIDEINALLTPPQKLQIGRRLARASRT